MTKIVGRPVAARGFPCANNPNKRHLHAMISDELDESIRAAARDHGLTLSELVTEALELWFEFEPKNTSERRAG